MLVRDANILIRAVLGRRVRQLLETYTSRGVRFYAPDDAYADAETYLPPLLAKRGISDEDLAATIQDLKSLVEPVNRDAYEHLEAEARERLRGKSITAPTNSKLPDSSFEGRPTTRRCLIDRSGMRNRCSKSKPLPSCDARSIVCLTRAASSGWTRC
jgi:PIN domain-containing protein